MNYLLDALAWIADPARWPGPDGIATRLGEHLAYSAVGVLIACAIGIPAGWLVGHTRRGRGLAVGLSGAARALPTLGVVTLLGILLGIGLVGPLVAFVVLALPSVLAGAYAGVEAVDPQAVDGARASGMTEAQVLTRVEIPLGLPLLVGGVRSAFLQVIATATLAAYVGAGGLGRYLFLGLKTQDYPQMLAASLLVVALALVCDLVFAALQRVAAPAGVRPH
ncbi:ABC transporter permease [Propioniciclava sinopodophylli]|uniref:ABC transporter permease n=1 Tax=Propioniciclava sinopodophylli TaxID=1837344 RepID=A0A4Q9KFW0_9ACTN|nr:ABC transporter permease [Propioniciclava sinopodophylli]TBT86512.1 ABC transporter permease [Propioniciclava sinopodophylli]